MKKARYIGDKNYEEMQLHAAAKEGNTMNRILKISLISAGSVAATALVSGLSYVKGKKDGFKLAAKHYESQLPQSQQTQSNAQQPHA